MERQLFFSGNEAIAHGAVRAGAGFACGYPGTPSTEIIEATARLEGIHSEWCVNEKVALETAVGASLAGVRTIVTMKHVGLNVAADPFMTLSLTGVNAGLVVISADDPGMHSSQNEQDNRNFARFAKVPMLEPSDSQEAYDFVAEAFELSEEFDTPVLLRTTTRISHGRGQVLPRVPVEVEPRDYARDISKYVMVPQYARQRNRLVLERLEKLRRRAEESPLNVLEAGSSDFGIIASGVAYAYAREAFPKAWFLKLGMSHPLPYAKVARLYEHVSRVAVVEELDPFFEEQVRALGLPVIGKAAIPADGELDQELVFRALEPYVQRKPPRRRRPVMPPAPSAGDAAAAGARPARQAAGALPRLLAPLGVLRAAQAPPRPDGRHRLLHARRAAAAARPRQLPVHGREHRHDGRLQQGARAQGGRGRHRRLHLLPLRHHAAHRRLLQRGRGHGRHPRQPHHRDDRSPGAPRHRPAPGPCPEPHGRHPEALRGDRRALRHRRRHRPQGPRRGHQGRGEGSGARRDRRAGAVRAHDA